jgi:hypothetical protein
MMFYPLLLTTIYFVCMYLSIDLALSPSINLSHLCLCHQFINHILSSLIISLYVDEVVIISDVLKAMQVPVAFAQGTLRLSFGRHTTISEIELAARYIIDAVHSLWNK